MDNESSQRSVGQPTKYKPEYCQELIDHMAFGFSYESFAAKVDVSRKALYKWEDAHQEWVEAKEVAFTKCQLYWEALGIRHILNTSESFGEGRSESRSLNGSVWIFNMKNRFKWRDKQSDEVDTVINNNINTLSDDELDRRIKELSGKE